ncbi:hypothetical protein ACLB2K_070858 [Fragaria x ananassa]
MVSAYALFTHPFPTPSFFDSPFPYSLPPTAHISHSSLSAFHNHQWSSLPTLAKTPRPEPNPLLTQLGFQPNPQFLLQCSSSPITADTGTVFSLLQAVGIDDKEAKVLLNKNPVLSFTSLDCLRARIECFNSVGLDGLVLSNLITKCPNLLTAEEIGPFLSFVRHDLAGKIEPGQLRKLFRAADVRFLVGFDEKVGLLLRHGVSDEKIVDVLNKVNLYKALCLKSVEDIDRTVMFLNRFGGIDLIVRRPSLLNYDLETQLAPRVEFLTEVSGGDENATGVLLGKLPAILSYTVDHTKGHVELLRSFAGLSDEQIFKILLVFPNVVSASRERKMRPRIKFLKECGLSSNDIYKFLIKAPLFLGLSFEDNLAYKLVFLVKIGYRYRTRDMAAAIGSATRTSSDNLQRVIELFLNYGFSCADIVVMSRRHPQILQYSHGALEKKMEYLINEMGREIGELLAFPAFLGYKLDDRIKARYEVKRKILGEGMSLNKLLTVSSESFTPKTPAYVIDLNVE